MYTNAHVFFGTPFITSISLSSDKILYLPCEEKQYKMGSSKKHVLCVLPIF